MLKSQTLAVVHNETCVHRLYVAERFSDTGARIVWRNNVPLFSRLDSTTCINPFHTEDTSLPPQEIINILLYSYWRYMLRSPSDHLVETVLMSAHNTQFDRGS